MASTRKTIVITLKITAPAGMNARQIRQEVKTRINEVAPYFDAFSLQLPDSAEGKNGYLRLRAANAKRED
jgi:hypothetical protein